jgi:Kdo2-lipid IVA lauroyltransferase/acyltransferase
MQLLDALGYACFRAFALLCAVLPPFAVRALCRAAARLCADGLRLRRTVVDRQLAACYPDLPARERARLARGVYDQLALTAAELLRPTDADRVEAVRVTPGWESVDQALAAGRGAVVAAAHLGNFELGGRVLAGRYRLLDVVKPLRNRRLDRWLQAARRRHGIGTVTVDGAAPAVLAHLRAGGLVSLLLDQDAGAAGVRIPFLGREAAAWPGAARFSLQTGCPVIPMAIVRQPGGGHVLQVGAALWPAGRGTDERAVRAYTLAISEAVEGFIRQVPAQWFWVHRRWKEVERAAPR